MIIKENQDEESLLGGSRSNVFAGKRDDEPLMMRRLYGHSFCKILTKIFRNASLKYCKLLPRLATEDK